MNDYTTRGPINGDKCVHMLNYMHSLPLTQTDTSFPSNTLSRSRSLSHSLALTILTVCFDQFYCTFTSTGRTHGPTDETELERRLCHSCCCSRRHSLCFACVFLLPQVSWSLLLLLIICTNFFIFLVSWRRAAHVPRGCRFQFEVCSPFLAHTSHNTSVQAGSQPARQTHCLRL